MCDIVKINLLLINKKIYAREYNLFYMIVYKSALLTSLTVVWQIKSQLKVHTVHNSLSQQKAI